MTERPSCTSSVTARSGVRFTAGSDDFLPAPGQDGVDVGGVPDAERHDVPLGLGGHSRPRCPQLRQRFLIVAHEAGAKVGFPSGIRAR